MAAYKVLQDIEAEDKLVGPMTARQLLCAGVAGAFLFVGRLPYPMVVKNQTLAITPHQAPNKALIHFKIMPLIISIISFGKLIRLTF